MKKAIILRGVPGVGKSTISAVLASLLSFSARIEQDVLRYMIIGGLIATNSDVEPGEDPKEYFRQCRLADKNAFALARNFVEAGFLPIISGLNAGESAEIFHLIEHPEDLKWYPEPSILAKELPGVGVHQVILDANPEILSNRMRTRGWQEDVIEFVLNERKLFLATAMDTEVELMIDTSYSTPLSVAQQIIAKLKLEDLRKD